MGKKTGGGKQRVVKYFMSQHIGVCHGPIEVLRRIFVGEKVAWDDGLFSQAQVDIDEGELFGGLKKEGGVEGKLWFLPGNSDQVLPELLAEKLGKTTATCPAFRGITSLFFTGVASDAEGDEGFYFTANNPYLRGIWAEVSRPSIGLDDAIARIYRAKSDGGVTPDNIELAEGLAGNSADQWDTNGNYAAHGTQSGDGLTIWTLPAGTQKIAAEASGVCGIHITDFDEIIARSNDTADKFEIYSAKTANKLQEVATGGDALNFNSFMDSIQTNDGYFVFCYSDRPIGNKSYTLLKRASGGIYSLVQAETISALAGAGAIDISSVSLGPDYAYCVLTNQTHIRRIAWPAMTESDIAPAGLTAAIAACHYSVDAQRVIIVCANGDMFAYSADLSTLLASNTTDNDFTIASVPQAQFPISKRLKSGPGKIGVVQKHDVSPWFTAHEFSATTLKLLRSVAAESFPGADDAIQFRHFAFNPLWTAIFLPSHFGVTSTWFLDPLDVYDSNPAHIIYECLTNAVWGMGAAASSIDFAAFSEAAQVLYDEEFGLSLTWTKQATIERFIQEILDHIQAMVFINPSTGLITLKLIRDDYDVETLPVLTKYNCTVTNFQRKTWGDTVNEIVVTCTNPKNYKPKTVVFQDLGNIGIQGGIVSDSRNYYGVRSGKLAKKLAVRDLRSASFPLAAAEVETNRVMWDIVPGAVVKLQDPEHGIGEIIMRVMNVDYGQPGNRVVKLSLMEDIFALPLAQFVEQEPPGTQWVPGNETPAPIEWALPLTLPYFFAVAVPATTLGEYPEAIAAMLAAQSGVDTKQFDLMGERTDAAGNLIFTTLGTRSIVARATLASALVAEAESAATDLTFTTRSQGPGPAQGGFIIIGDGGEDENEIAMIESVAAGIYTIKRGVLDTVPRAWPIGTPVWFISPLRATIHDPVVRSAFETVDYKVLPRTSLGRLAEADAELIPLTIIERPHLPSRPADVKVEGEGFAAVDVSASPPTNLAVTWGNRNRLTEDSQVLAWDDAGVTPEAGQTTTIYVLHPITRAVIATHAGETGSSFNLPVASFGAEPIGIVRVVAVRDALESLQGHEIPVKVAATSTLAISGTPILTAIKAQAYAGFTVTATGGVAPYSFSLQGTWPTGLIITQTAPDEAEISGTPTEDGSFASLSVRVTDSLADTDDLPTFTLAVDPEDVTAPVLSDSVATVTGPTTADIEVDTDEGNGTLYWVVTQSATPPTALQIKGGADENGDPADAAGSQAVSGTGTQLDNVTGLIEDTTYYAHFMQEDTAGNRSNVETTAAFIPDDPAATITSSNTFSVAENATLSHALTANESVTWSIVGGADQARFEISGSTLRWLSNGTKDFEAPDDADTNNTYIVTVRATDTHGNTTDQTITGTVTDVADTGPTLTYHGSQELTSGVTTFASQAIGTASADRLVIMVIVGVRASATPRTVSSVDIGGTNGTIHVQVGNGAGVNGPVLAIASRVVAAGTTMNSSVTFSGALTTTIAHFYTLKNYNSATPVDTKSNAVASGDPSVALNITGPGGVALAVWAGSSGTAGGAAFTGAATEDYDAATASVSNSQNAAAHETGLSTQTGPGRTVSVNSGMTAEVIAAASWN